MEYVQETDIGRRDGTTLNFFEWNLTSAMIVAWKRNFWEIMTDPQTDEKFITKQF